MNRVQWFLNKMTQEASELIKDATKTSMFGLESYDPQDPNQTPNLQLVVEEFFDLLAVFEQFIDEVGARDKVELLFDGNKQFEYIQRKKDKNSFYLGVCQNIGSTFTQPVEYVPVKVSHNCSNCKACNCNGSCGCSCDVPYESSGVKSDG